MQSPMWHGVLPQAEKRNLNSRGNLGCSHTWINWWHCSKIRGCFSLWFVWTYGSTTVTLWCGTQTNQDRQEELLLSQFRLKPGAVLLQWEHNRCSNRNKYSQYVLPGNRTSWLVNMYNMAFHLYVLLSLPAVRQSVNLSFLCSLTIFINVTVFVCIVQHREICPSAQMSRRHFTS